MENIKISVITASYNYANFIAEAIMSVIAQSYNNWELIIVDDGSGDNSIEVIKDFCNKDDRIKLFKHDGGVNRGLKETILLGISKSNGDYVAFLESDDIWTPDNLQKKVDVIKKFPEAKIIFNDVELFGEESVISDYDKYFSLNKKFLSRRKYPANLFNAFSFQNIIPTFSCVMVEKKLLEQADFNPSVEAFLDHWIWAQLSYENKFYYISEKLTLWRMHKKSYIEQKQQGNEKNFLFDLQKHLQNKGYKKKMCFWNRHKHPKIEKLFRGFFRNFA